MARARKASNGRAWFQNEIGRRNLKGCDRCSRFPCVHPDAGRSVTGLPDPPEIFAQTLVHHLLVHTAASRIAPVRAHRKILVCELTPDADHFDARRFVGGRSENRMASPRHTLYHRWRGLTFSIATLIRARNDHLVAAEMTRSV